MVSKDVSPEKLFGAEISEQSSSCACVLDLNIGLSGLFSVLVRGCKLVSLALHN